MGLEDRRDDVGGGERGAEERETTTDVALTPEEFQRAHAEAIARERARLESLDASALAEEIAKAQATLEELGNRREDHARRMEALLETCAALEARGDDPAMTDRLLEMGAELVRAYDLERELHGVARRVMLHLRELERLYRERGIAQA